MDEWMSEWMNEWMNEHLLSKPWHIFTSIHSPVEQSYCRFSIVNYVIISTHPNWQCTIRTKILYRYFVTIATTSTTTTTVPTAAIVPKLSFSIIIIFTQLRSSGLDLEKLC